MREFVSVYHLLSPRYSILNAYDVKYLYLLNSGHTLAFRQEETASPYIHRMVDVRGAGAHGLHEK